MTISPSIRCILQKRNSISSRSSGQVERIVTHNRQRNSGLPGLMIKGKNVVLWHQGALLQRGIVADSCLWWCRAFWGRHSTFICGRVPCSCQVTALKSGHLVSDDWPGMSILGHCPTLLVDWLQLVPTGWCTSHWRQWNHAECTGHHR